MAENEQKSGENVRKSPEQKEKKYHIMREWLQQLLDENKILKQRLSVYEKPLEKYDKSWSWITKTVFIITHSSEDKLYRSCELIMAGANKKNGQDRSNEVLQQKKELETYKKRLDNAQTLMLDGELMQQIIAKSRRS